MYSLNVPLPGAVADRVAGVQADLPGADFRESPTLVAKRLDPDGTVASGITPFAELRTGVEAALADVSAFPARIDRVGVFEHPPAGTAPVVYLAVESPGLVSLHDRLCRSFAPAPAIEGRDYVPHVTVARGGHAVDARRLDGTAVEPVEWTVDEFTLYDADNGATVDRFALSG